MSKCFTGASARTLVLLVRFGEQSPEISDQGGRVTMVSGQESGIKYSKNKNNGLNFTKL